MEKDLKAENMVSLGVIYVGVFALVALVHWSAEEVFEFTEKFVEQAGVMAIIVGFGAILANFLPNHIKHPVVYFRIRNVLSGHRCRKLCERDPRLDKNELRRKWPELFAQEMDESEQNPFWYKNIYSPVKNDPEVRQAHRSFLLYRDAASGLFILLLGLLLWHGVAVYISLPALSGWALLILSGVILVLCRAGKQSGDRMVVNAVALNVVR